MPDNAGQRPPKTQPAAAGGPPKPPKKAARDAEDDLPNDPELEIPDPITVKDLAIRLAQRPFIIVADLMMAGHWCFLNDPLNFEIASKVIRKHGFSPKRASPG
jgi:hypothetical protein